MEPAQTQGVTGAGTDDGEMGATTQTLISADLGSAPRLEASRSEDGAGLASRESVTPHAVLLAEEVQRTRMFALFVLVLAASAFITVTFFTGGVEDAKRVHQAGTLIGVAAATWTLWKLMRPEDYQPHHTLIFGGFCVVAIASGYAYWGDLSAVMTLLPIGIYFFALSESLLGTLALYVLAMIPHAVLNVAITVGAVDERGILQAKDMDTLDRIGGLLLVHFIVGSSFVLARHLRAGRHRRIEELERAVRGVAQREALLAEARAELEEVAQVGGPGRYSDHILGGYKLGVVIGRGAMGEIYEASHVETGEPVAAKLLHVKTLANANARARFLREVDITKSLNVENIVRVIYVPELDEAIPYLIMERLHGDSLADILRREPKQKAKHVIEMMRQLGRGVRAAHDAGIVHRDLKPQNIFQHRPSSGVPVWKVLDFGVCKLMEHGSGTLTRGNVVGTPAYMAPEQARGEEVDLRCDVYSLSVIAYRALTGRPAFGGRDIPSLLFSVVNDMPPRPSSLGRVLPGFDAVLAIGMAKAREDRFDSVGELVNALMMAVADDVEPSYLRRAERLEARHPWAD